MLAQEILFDILSDLNRRDLDALELVNRALGSLITAKFDDAPWRVITVTFCEHGQVMLTCPSDGRRRVSASELPQYIPRSVIAKVVFRWAHAFIERTYQALLPCRPHLAADAVCDFRSTYVFHPDILRRALTEVLTCSTFVFAEHSSSVMDELRLHMGVRQLAAFPCFANCANLQIAHFDDMFSGANGALKWLVGTHAVAAGVKRLSIKNTKSSFLVAFVDGIEQQFIHATTPASFNVELMCVVRYGPAPAVGTTRELVNVNTNEKLRLRVDTKVRTPNGWTTSKTKVTIRRKAVA
ncbi:hypothetical protein AAVH_30871 [Aphelenchoides avenae]|nr:hypothetical protein AAVH_30871 [Aphelenchus avenae]